MYYLSMMLRCSSTSVNIVYSWHCMCVQRQTISEGDEVVLSYLAPLLHTNIFLMIKKQWKRWIHKTHRVKIIIIIQENSKKKNAFKKPEPSVTVPSTSNLNPQGHLHQHNHHPNHLYPQVPLDFVHQGLPLPHHSCWWGPNKNLTFDKISCIWFWK